MLRQSDMRSGQQSPHPCHEYARLVEKKLGNESALASLGAIAHRPTWLPPVEAWRAKPARGFTPTMSVVTFGSVALRFRASHLVSDVGAAPVRRRSTSELDVLTSPLRWPYLPSDLLGEGLGAFPVGAFVFDDLANQSRLGFL